MRTVAQNKATRQVTRRMAEAMVGREVSVRTKTSALHGIVTTVVWDGAEPRVVVGGSGYPLSTVMSVVPMELGLASSHAE